MSTPDHTDRNAMRNVVPLAIWTLAWAVSLAIASFGPELWKNPVISWIALGLNIAVGVGWIVEHARYLRGVDDLQRKIMLDAIGVALGAGLIGGCAAAAASNVGLIAFEPGIAFLVVLMAVVYIVGVAVGTVRYR